MKKILLSVAISSLIIVFSFVLPASALPEINPNPKAVMLPDTITVTDVTMANGELLTGYITVGLYECPFSALFVPNPKQPTGADAILIVGNNVAFPECGKYEHILTQEEIRKTLEGP